MTRAALIVTVAFAAYAAISSVLALVVGRGVAAGSSRAESGRSRRAGRPALVRAADHAVGARRSSLSAGVVIPVFVAFEPVRDYEPVGPAR